MKVWPQRPSIIRRCAGITSVSDPGDSRTCGPHPNTVDLTLSGQSIRLLHASPFNVNHRILQRDPIEKLESMFASTDFTGYGFDPDMVGYGHPHSLPRTFRRRTLFNIGSVGNPLDQPTACYAILEGSSDDVVAIPVAITIVRVPYDIERAIREAEAEHMPELEPYANALRTAR